MSKLILSLDGGGIRGAATSRFLSMIEEQLKNKHGKSIRDCVDFYAGTSTGSIIALALATTDLSLKQISDLYNLDNAKKIFTENRGLFEIDGLNAPKYEAEGKTTVLEQELKKYKIKDTPQGKHILVVTYGIEKRMPMIIKSAKNEHLDLFSYQVADASSAAPTYFPTKELEIPPGNSEFWLIDGGIVANNPTMCAIAEAKRVWNLPIDKMRVLSVGTGYRTRKINGPASQKWGAVRWFTKGDIIDLLSDERIVAYQARAITKPGSYIRVNAELKAQPGLSNPPDDALDDISKTNIERLKQLGEFWFKKYGEDVIKLLLGTYTGVSLDRIDPESGEPVGRQPLDASTGKN